MQPNLLEIVRRLALKMCPYSSASVSVPSGGIQMGLSWAPYQVSNGPCWARDGSRFRANFPVVGGGGGVDLGDTPTEFF
jgi:hypothetical protein